MTPAPIQSMSLPGSSLPGSSLPVADVVDLRPGRLSQAAVSGSAAAIERLDASRQALRLALTRSAHPPRRAPVSAGNAEGGLLHKMALQIRNVPALGVAVESAQHWWREQPARAAAAVIVAGSRSAIVPIAQRRPGSLLLAAFGVGAAIILVRPWRFLLRPALLFGLVTRIASHAVKARFTGASGAPLLRRPAPPTRIR